MVKHFVKQPLPSSFMIISVLGLLFSIQIVWPASMTWGFTMTLIFTIWFVAAVYNFTHAPGEKHLDMHGSDEYLNDLPRMDATASKRLIAVILSLFVSFFSYILTWHEDHKKFWTLLVLTAALITAAAVTTAAIIATVAQIALAAIALGVPIHHIVRSDDAFKN